MSQVAIIGSRRETDGGRNGKKDLIPVSRNSLGLMAHVHASTQDFG
jgi:hypothetical protein